MAMELGQSSRMASLACNLPQELMINILVLLPVESILRFKAVCKSWNQLLSSHSFKIAHSISPSTSYIFEDNRSLNYIDDASNSVSRKLRFHPQGGLRYRACGHGMVCLISSFSHLFFIGNSATCKFRPLPSAGDDFLLKTVGLYFQPSTCNFKILAMGSNILVESC
ncbi:F-box/kelch-repeat protein At3g23880 [Amborella trichopoda]|uniref:F-box domain-containing protein n=1 Tax=Amborella trichopoda TaxID=13333 RepID=U5D4B2_AMBTC|nr:F-box/kelch-repeat protein At3g23880 [Amborella trichopoda]ERN20451.1 hypothetical protein AMTR_s00068p00126550 [Amborella trichopoda]|eukprot:XP_006858984.1 F-box/kelch-repeat protein At3g23880 [Amborella trichopoda]